MSDSETKEPRQMATQQNQSADPIDSIKLAVYIAHYQADDFHAAILLNGKYLTSVHLKTNDLGDLHCWFDSDLPSPVVAILAANGRPVKGDGWCPDIYAFRRAALDLGMPDQALLTELVIEACQKEADKANRRRGYYELGWQA